MLSRVLAQQQDEYEKEVERLQRTPYQKRTRERYDSELVLEKVEAAVVNGHSV